MTSAYRTTRLATLCTAAVLLTACGDGSDETAAASAGDTPAPTTALPNSSNVRTNQAPTIGGQPADRVYSGTLYQFRPSVADADGDALTYMITNRPPWAAFDRTSGRLQGMPGTADAGTYAGIVIGVTDGRASAELKGFSIMVADPKVGFPADGGTTSGTGGTSGGTTSGTTPTTINSSPTLAGTPPASVLVGTQYSFTPQANDGDGDALTFSITNKPSWASFSSSTGRLQGTPAAEHVGAYGNITIRVTDGIASAALPAFTINVTAVANGSATLSWTPPTQNEDGTALTNLAGYKIHWGSSSGNYSNSVTINNVGITTYMVESLVAGTYYFATSAFNGDGIESNYSNEAAKTVQ